MENFPELMQVISLHVGAILTSARSRIRTSSTAAAVSYITISVLIAGAGLVLFLWEIWRQMVI